MASSSGSGKGKATAREIPGSSRRTARGVPNVVHRPVTKESQDSLYSALNFFPNPALTDYYRGEVGLPSSVSDALGDEGYPSTRSFYDNSHLSRGEQMVQAARGNGSSTQNPPSFHFNGSSYGRRGERKVEVPIYPGYVPARPKSQKQSPEQGKQCAAPKEDPVCVDIASDDSPGTSSGKSSGNSEWNKEFLRFSSRRDEMDKAAFASSSRLRPRDNANSFYGSRTSPKAILSAATSSTKRKSSSSSSSSDERKRSDEVLPMSFDDQLASESTRTPATRRRRGRSFFSSGDENDEAKDDFDWRQIKDPNQYLEYPKDSPRRLVVTGRDLKTLMTGHFLNDSIIDFYLKYLETEGLDVEIRSRAYFFSCFFYKRLVERIKHEDETEGFSETALRHDRVKNWTRNTDLFSHDFIVIPVNKGAHWFLVIVCRAGEAFRLATASHNAASIASTSSSASSTLSIRPCILIFDSLGVKHLAAKSCAKTIVAYLKEEYKLKKNVGDEAFGVPFIECLPWFAPKIPQQPNGSDCGIYVLHFAEKFLREPFTADSEEEFKADRRGWFPRSQVAGKRREIRDLILQLGGFS